MHASKMLDRVAFTFLGFTLFASAAIAMGGEAPTRARVENQAIRDDFFERRVKEMNEAVQAKEKEGLAAMVAEFEQNVLKLLSDFPGHPGLPDVLVKLATVSPKEEARKLVEKALEISPDEPKAKALQTRLDAIGKPFVLKFKALGGREVDLAKMRGKVVLVDFWATWCGPCVKELPKLQEIYDRLRPEGLEIVGVSLDYDRQKLERFVALQHITWPQQFDGNGFKNDLVQKYGVLGIPTTFLVDKKGLLREATLQLQLEARIKELLAE